ncbi:TQXA domain-containing protein [Streptoalloteichus tenebrarius]|uniref:TQXA domain-containing protein n=1 Tax=Streptoalloteichus tenebrarius (strain ATCC 17920 / DSM 40477 / JCM 4838 / CBS 697.72 / NBRC 16177 / NCIMB 11028 / NRRL B-12390 / A12253. 1 / ISP 5477) TaxID=1933 RepID=A0ABT1HRC2_STRSD|nr:Cys-Gln thioester bond-forming surface protein [Streptoalloteichus tenebrarius]MCP2258070.1 TQXA domain-containing protein [Streptoalloteichus tenebrarius]BFF01741.1 thioester domain-containing protein [Streptoalloteichus tenebrarius]
MASRLHPARLGAAFLGTAVALLASALPASAEATGEVALDPNAGGEHVRMNGKPEPTSLIGLRLSDGRLLKTYCVELTEPARNGFPMKEAHWDEYPDGSKSFKSQPDKVLWILNHSYPNVDTDALGKVIEAKDLTPSEAIAGTQAAIWHFSNGAKLDEQGNDDDVKKLYKYLTGEKNVGQKTQPPVSLKLSPEKAEGAPGDKIGPFTVDTTASEAKLSVKKSTADGVQVVTAEGKPVTSAKGGDKVFVQVPADAKGGTGEATVQAEAEATVEKGRLFVGSDRNKRTQTLITAESMKTSVKAHAEAAWKKKTTPSSSSGATTPSNPGGPTTSVSTSASQPPSSVPVTPAPVTSTTQAQPVPASNNDNLANTGASVLGAIGVGIVLVGGGATALILQRRRKKA